MISFRGIPRDQRRQVRAKLNAAYLEHVNACAAYGLTESGRPIMPPDNFDHFACEWLAVYQLEQTEQPVDLNQIRHGKRDYSETYRAPLDVSLI